MKQGDTSLENRFMQALKKSDVATVKQCLEQGVNVNLRIPYEFDTFTYLHQSLGELMIEEVTGYKYPIHLAARYGNTAILKLLLAYKADINAKASDGTTPLILATDGNHKDAVLWLLQKRASPNETLKDKSIALHVAAYKGYEWVVQALISHHSDINKVDDDGETPLLAALSNQKPNTAKVLIENGADMNMTNANNACPLFFAAQEGYESLVKLLLEKNANPNITRNSDKTSPLQMAALKGHLGVVRLLVEAGANLMHKDTDGLTAAQWAKGKGYSHIASYLEQCISKNSSKNSSSLFKPLSDEEMAKDLYRKREYYRAAEYFDKAIQQVSNQEKQAALYCNIGHCYFALKNYKMATAAYGRAIELKDDSISAYEWRAKSYRKLVGTGLVKENETLYLALAVEDENKVSQLKNNTGKKLVI